VTEALDAPVLAFDVGGTKIAAAIVAGKQVQRRAQLPTPRTGRGDDIVAALATLAENLAGTMAVGVATTGIVNKGELTAINSATLAIEDHFPLAARLGDKLGVPPLLINDAQAAAWAEYRYGAGRGARAMAYMTVSTGIGGAFVLDGRLQVGARGLAGHIGHVAIDIEGSLCGCGRRGCIERNASGTAIAAFASEQYNEAVDAQEVFRRASRGDRIGSDILNRAARQISGTLIDCIAMLDLDCVVVGGGVGLAAGFIDRISAEVDMAPKTFRRPVLAARFGADAGLIGVARLANERKFHA
jgi:N-acylmannosamine kinase